jgi:hypothetical protein
MAKRTLAARRKEVGRQAAHIRSLLAANRFTKKEKEIFLFAYLHALISNKSTTDVVYQIAFFRPSTMLEELENFANGR